MRQTLEDLLVKYEHPIVINCDNTSAINMSKNPIMHSKTKHIPIKYHYLREHVSQKVVKIEYIGTKEYIANLFTKPLPKEAFKRLRQKLGVNSSPQQITQGLRKGLNGKNTVRVWNLCKSKAEVISTEKQWKT